MSASPVECIHPTPYLRRPPLWARLTALLERLRDGWHGTFGSFGAATRMQDRPLHLSPREPVYITVALDLERIDRSLLRQMTSGERFFLRRRSAEHGSVTFEVDKVLQMPTEHKNLVCRGYRVEGATE